MNPERNYRPERIFPRLYGASDVPYACVANENIIGSLATTVQPFRFMSQFWEGIRRGACKILFLGDSVTENVSQNYPMAHWTREFQREIERAFPWVTFTYVNMAIGGRQARHVLGYKAGGAIPTTTLGSEYLSTTGTETQSTNFLVLAATGKTCYPSPDRWPGPPDSQASAWGASEVWMNRLIGHNADLVTLCFGLNEENTGDGSNDSGGDSYFAQAMQSIISHIRSASAWASNTRPSIVGLTPYNDTHAREKRNRLAEQARAIFSENDIPCIDANRWDSILVEGVDPIRRRWFGEAHFRYLLNGKTNRAVSPNYSNYWQVTGTPQNAGSSSAYIARTTANDTGVYALKMLRKRAARDVQVNVHFGSPSSGTPTEAVCAVFYRVNPSNNAIGYEVKHSGTTLSLIYHDGTNDITLATQSVTGFPDTSSYLCLTVRAVGGRHQVWLAVDRADNGATYGNDSGKRKKIFDLYHTGADPTIPLTSEIFRPGWVGFSIGSTGTAYPTFYASAPIQETALIEFGDPLPILPPALNAYDLNGYVSEWPGSVADAVEGNPDSPGGNTINHLKTDAYTMVYGAVVGDFVKQLAASRQDVQTLPGSAEAVSVSATTSEEILRTITIPGTLLAKNGSIEIDLQGSVNSTADDKTLRVRFGTIGTSSAICFAAVVTASFGNRYLVTIQNRNNEASQVAFQAGVTGASGVAALTPAVNTAIDQNIYITGQKETAGDTLTLERYSIRLLGG